MADYCQQCGSKLSNQISEGRMRDVCETCGWIFYAQWKVSAGVQVVNDGKLLLIQRSFNPWKGCWHMPAGYVEVDEDPSLAAEREALEETGLIVKVEKLENVYTDYEDPRGNVLVLIYIAHTTGGDLSTTSETMAVGFFTPEETRNLPIAGISAQNAITSWIESQEVNQ